MRKICGVYFLLAISCWQLNAQQEEVNEIDWRQTKEFFKQLPFGLLSQVNEGQVLQFLKRFMQEKKFDQIWVGHDIHLTLSDKFIIELFEDHVLKYRLVFQPGNITYGEMFLWGATYRVVPEDVRTKIIIELMTMQRQFRQLLMSPQVDADKKNEGNKNSEESADGGNL